ncbi:MAG: hypothetical protein IJ638_04415, partial [Alphaproteobacteria bacterium]|nr:hypothetical protein [Alphaproteobacteria bacterium]
MRNKISILTLSLLGIASVFVENDATARRSNVRAFKQSQMAKKVIKASDATNSSGAVITPNANNTVTTASDCPAGTYFDGSSSCVGCPIGTWSGAGATSCTTCGDNVATCNATNGNPISCQSGYKVEGTICVVDSNSGADPDEIARFKELKQKYALQVAEVSASCSGIAAELERISGLNKVATVSSGVGTLAAGGAVATSMMKAHEDNKTVDQKKEEADKAYAEWHNKVVELDGKIKSKSELTENDIKDFNKDLNKLAKEVGKNYTSKTKEELESNSGALSNFSADEYKDVAAKDSSKTLGNVTTGLMAGATLTSGTSAVTSYVASA